MTLSATGDAETPAGGSVCIRCTLLAHVDETIRNWIDRKIKVVVANRSMRGEQTLKSRIKRRRADVDIAGSLDGHNRYGWRGKCFKIGVEVVTEKTAHV